MRARSKNTKKLLCAGLAVCLTMGTGLTAMAGTWRRGAAPNENRWWYDFDNGSYAMGWQWIDGNQDGTAEAYYFDESGWLLTGAITPDGYTVDANGAWIVNGQVQTKAAEAQQAQDSQGQQSSQNQAVQGNGQYVSGSWTDGTWTDISREQRYADFWDNWVWALMAIPDSDDVVERAAEAIEYWAVGSQRGAEWKAAFDRYGVRPDLYAETIHAGTQETVTLTTPAGIEAEAQYDVENAVKMMLRIRTDDMGDVTSCVSTVNGDGTITVTLSYRMGG